ncbi:MULTISPECIES: thioredoxin family protein [Streptomyces]|uniref:Thioredoxin family protein n=1 Tax=Streptomyces sudanensis TaxID=436397 RepID=A0ABY4TFJ5_9ACTN|nr:MULTISPECIES: thioredoxin family protein [Streptomyces]MCP9958523.1 thioredoxin family protein [Streptomyces sudanensis]MCP9987640.1 thioredoxin family protein [Streptomyces sudanensis]MCQ0000967.1 thioredoxin family protein [Streptomyces sudanensis]URN16553.1 thioredoxin family protein [Streptomyces sudanensis]
MYRKLAVAATAVAMLLGGTAATAVAAPAAPAAEAPAAATIPNVVDVTSANYAQVMQWSYTKPVVLDFTASWCYWCQKQKPYLQQYNTADNGAWVWAKVDVDRNRDLYNKYAVRGIPALLNIQNGKEAGSRMVGFDGPTSLRNWLNNL